MKNNLLSNYRSLDRHPLIWLGLCLYFVTSNLAAEDITVSYLNRPPYYYTYNKKPAGLLIKIQQKIFKKAKLTSKYRQIPPQRILFELKNLKIPYCSIGWFKTTQREKFAQFSLPIWQDNPSIIMYLRSAKEKFTEVHSFHQLIKMKNLIPGIIEGFSYGEVIDDLLDEQNKHVLTIPTNQKDLVKMLAAGRMDYIIVAPEEVDSLLQNADLDKSLFIIRHFADIPMGNKRYIICNRQVRAKDLDRINQAIKTLIIQPSDKAIE